MGGVSLGDTNGEKADETSQFPQLVVENITSCFGNSTMTLDYISSSGVVDSIELSYSNGSVAFSNYFGLTCSRVLSGPKASAVLWYTYLKCFCIFWLKRNGGVAYLLWKWVMSSFGREKRLGEPATNWEIERLRPHTIKTFMDANKTNLGILQSLFVSQRTFSKDRKFHDTNWRSSEHLICRLEFILISYFQRHEFLK